MSGLDISEKKLTIGFRENTEVPVLVLRELRVEGLQQSPDIWGSGHSTSDLVVAIGESSADGLINIEHIGIAIPAVRIQGWRASPVYKMARTILLEKTNHATAARASVKPGSKWCRCGIAPSLEEPKPPLNVSGGKITIHECTYIFMLVPTDRYPEYWLTPFVVSQMPELVTNSIFAPVAACSKTV